ncbi:diguanylate cyclase [Arcobacter sp. FWKO B]|uniref:diguanylate cyclase n=1 Tax=Arcobacter sp. FWKO B TaxID=2593672 RepID=UPI0018A66CFB|nr:diguanylate cyclase [Arcobacter sp. FWKO B]QOG11560.1 diguanylate cyclase [Arcobacter sp. FWKO B]
MAHNIKNKNVIFTILTLFIVSFSIYSILTYIDSKQDMEYLKSKNIQQLNNLHSSIQENLENQLKSRINFILHLNKRNEKIDAINNNDQKALFELFSPHFESLKGQINGFSIMQIFDTKGISLIRLHDSNNHSDDLSQFRACVKDVIQNPRSCTFFEVGKNGLALRHITPIRNDENKIIAFLELGVTPYVFAKQIQNIFDSKSYFFIKDEFAVSNNKNKLSTFGYSLCTLCSSKDEFIDDIAQTINLNNKEHDDIKYGHKTYSIFEKSIYDALGQEIGKIVIFNDISSYTDQLQTLILKSIILLIGTLIASYILLNGYIKKIFDKLNFSKFLLNNINDEIYVVSTDDLSIMDVNERACITLGYTYIEIKNLKLSDFTHSYNNEIQIDWYKKVNELKQKHFIISREIHARKDGQTFPVESNISYIKTDTKEFMLLVSRDITNQIEMENKINQKAKELQRLNTIISKSALYTTTDLNGNITYISEAFANLTGYDKDYLIGKNHRVFKHDSMQKEFFDTLWSTISNNQRFVGEVKNYRKDGTSYWTKIVIDPIFDDNGQKIGYSSYRENITDKKELEYISSHDALTGIYNRREFVKRLQAQIKSASRYNEKFGFIILDIDYFKKINDTYGHQVGDEVLITLSNIIKENLRADDFFARWGGEEFVIIAKYSDIKSLEELVHKLQNKISIASFAPVPRVNCSFGLTIYKDGDNDESIVKRADKALYLAKENGRNRYEIG